MSYIGNNLLTNEKIYYRTRRHWIIFFIPVVLSVIAFVLIDFHSLLTLVGYLFCALAIIQWLSSIIDYLTSEYGVTNRRVLVKTGFVRRHSLETLLPRIAGIKVNQSLFGRIFGYGTIVIQGTGGAHDRFAMIDDPLRFRRKVQEQIDMSYHKLETSL